MPRVSKVPPEQLEPPALQETRDQKAPRDPLDLKARKDHKAPLEPTEPVLPSPKLSPPNNIGFTPPPNMV
jgi:hypothetical protein